MITRMAGKSIHSMGRLCFSLRQRYARAPFAGPSPDFAELRAPVYPRSKRGIPTLRHHVSQLSHYSHYRLPPCAPPKCPRPVLAALAEAKP
jgi:hypothetical protein